MNKSFFPLIFNKIHYFAFLRTFCLKIKTLFIFIKVIHNFSISIFSVNKLCFL